jgi:hypothetical protein
MLGPRCSGLDLLRRFASRPLRPVAVLGSGALRDAAGQIVDLAETPLHRLEAKLALALQLAVGVLLGLRHAALGRLHAVARLVELAAGGGQLSVDRRLLTLQLLLANPVGVLGLCSAVRRAAPAPSAATRPPPLLCLLVELAAGVRGGILLPR